MNQETPEEKKLRIERQIEDANAYVEALKAKWCFPPVDKFKASRGVAIGPRANMRKILRDKRRKIGPIDPEYAELVATKMLTPPSTNPGKNNKDQSRRSLKAREALPLSTYLFVSCKRREEGNTILESRHNREAKPTR